MPSCATYLEIGVDAGHTFANVDVPFRWGVDPHPKFSVTRLPAGARFSRETSDVFFDQLVPQSQFELTFLDGLHEWGQTYRDLLATLRHSPAHALVIIDDVVPDDRWAADPDHALALERKRAAGIMDSRWQGDVYKVMLAILALHPELDFHVIDDANPQAIVWRTGLRPHARSPEETREILSNLAKVTYDEVFVDGRPPESFRTTSESAALEAALAASRKAWDAGSSRA